MKKIIGFICVLILSFGLIRSLTENGYFPMHDDTQVARVVVMGRALKDGQFPVRWVSDLGYGYGYPIYNFYGPLPYYFGGLLFAMGVNSIVATKLMFAAGILIASAATYFVLLPSFGILGAITASIVSSYVPYHAVDIYVRGAVGEFWAIAFMPLVLYGFLKSFQPGKFGGIAIGAAGLAGVILSHTILGYISVGFMVFGYGIAWIVLAIRKKLTRIHIVNGAALLIFGLGLSATFWIPAFTEMKFTGVTAMIQNAPTNFFDHFVCYSQLWNSPWGFGGSASGCTDGMSLKIGKFHIILTILGFVLWFSAYIKRKRGDDFFITGLSIIILIVSLIGVLPLSAPVWRLVPYFSFLQYPWRLYSYSVLVLGIIGTFPLRRFHGQFLRIMYCMSVVTLCLFVNAKLFQPKYIYPAASSVFESRQDIRFRVSKISDEYLPPGISKPSNSSELFENVITGENLRETDIMKDTSVNLKAVVVSSRKQSIVIRKAFFPGWSVIVNGNTVQPIIEHGLISVVLSEGKSVVELRFADTPVRQIANGISIVSFVMLGYCIYYAKKTVT